MLTRLLKLLLNLKIIFLFLGLVYLSPFSFAETSATDSTIQEDHDTKNLDQVLMDYNKDQAKVLKDAEKLLPSKNDNDTGELSDKELGDGDVLDPNDEKNNDGRNRVGSFNPGLLKKRLEEKNTQPKALKTDHADNMRKQLKILQSKSEAELSQLLLDQTAGTQSGAYLRRFPKLALFTIRLARDKDALPNLVGIIDNTDREIHFVGVMLVTILISILLKKFMKREGRPIWKAVSFWFFRFFTISALRFAVILYFYSKEITPVLKIAEKTFF